MPDISIITPAYNRAGLLPRVWRSIGTQKADFEWIVVDDASEDETGAIVNGIGDSRILYVRMNENQGVNAARNAGVLASRGRLIVFLDSDDELYPDALEDVITHMHNTSRSIGVALYASINARSGRPINAPSDGSILSEYDIVCREALAGGDMICVYRREVFDHFKLPEKLKGCEQVFVFHISKKFKFLMVNKPLSIVHRQYDNMSSSDSSISRSFDIAKSYELLIENHSELLERNPSAMKRYLNKAMYRYGIAGSRGNVWRTYKRLLHVNPGYGTGLVETSLMCFCMLGLAPFERRRIDRLNKKLNFS